MKLFDNLFWTRKSKKNSITQNIIDSSNSPNIPLDNNQIDNIPNHLLVTINGKVIKPETIIHTSQENIEMNFDTINSFESLYKLGPKIGAFFNWGFLILGAGTFGTVYQINKISTNQSLAVKIIPKILLKGKMEMVRNEIKVMSSISHENIINLIDSFETEKDFIIVSDLATGGELFQQLSERGHFDEKEAANLIKQILNGIAYLHSKHIVHRDLKPENLLFKDKSIHSTILIADFGLSKLAEHDYALHTACGTPAFVAPEIIRRKGHGLPTDMWSMGVITYVLLSGFLPFSGSSPNEIFKNIIQCQYEFFSPEWDLISKEAKDFISKLLVLNPDDRITVGTALSHNWLLNNSSKDISQAPKRFFNAKSAFKKAGNLIISVNRIKNSQSSLNSQDHSNDDSIRSTQ